MKYEKLIEKDKKLIKLQKIRKIILPVIIISVISLVIAMYYFLFSNIFKIYALVMLILLVLIMPIYPIVSLVYKKKYNFLYNELEKSILEEIGITRWKYETKCDDSVYVKSKQGVFSYTDIKYFKEKSYCLAQASKLLVEKEKYKKLLSDFIRKNNYTNFSMYKLIKEKIEENLLCTNDYYIVVSYISPAGRSFYQRVLSVSKFRINEFITDKSILMSKSEYNKYIKENERKLLEEKQHEYYQKVNNIIDLVNDKDSIIIKKDVDELEKMIDSLFVKVVHNIKKIKNINSEEWDIIDKIINNTEIEVSNIIKSNKQILDYYSSYDFIKVKKACEELMNSQKDFNEYIEKKVQALTDLFGTRIIRNETYNEDKYNYIHPYKKTINPFVVELSSNVFGSAENSPLEYVVKYFYPDKRRYPEQINKLQLLIEELETLKDAKQIIETLKKDIEGFLIEVPDYVIKNDEEGFYSRLGFAAIDENTLTVEYKFAYTSDGGKAHRHFSIPMTEETIIELINVLENKLTIKAFTKEQRALLTRKLRLQIIERDNCTCKNCGNSTHKEPNLLLEIDHIIPIAKGGITEESNLQTLCWKCNRQKGSKMLSK